MDLGIPRTLSMSLRDKLPLSTLSLIPPPYKCWTFGGYTECNTPSIECTASYAIRQRPLGRYVWNAMCIKFVTLWRSLYPCGIYLKAVIPFLWLRCFDACALNPLLLRRGVFMATLTRYAVSRISSRWCNYQWSWGGGWYHDNPSHKCLERVLKRSRNYNGSIVEVLPSWYPQNHDLCIIWNVWAWVQREVGKIMCESFENRAEAHAETMAKGPNTTLTNPFASMKQTMKLMIEKEGGSTRYKCL